MAYGTGDYGGGTYGTLAAFVASPGTAIAPASRTPDGRLSISVKHADGNVTRLGPDEVDAANIPMGLNFGDQLPGGFTDAGLSLLTRIDLESPLSLFDEVTMLGPGNEIAWQGYITQLPRSHGEGFAITPGAVGYSALLKWDPSFTEVYVDRDPKSWSEAPLDYRVARVTAGDDFGSIPQPDLGDGIMWPVPNQLLPSAAVSMTAYQAPAGVSLSRLMYKGTRTGTTASFESPTLFSGDDWFGSFTSTALTLDSTLRTVSAAGRYFFLRVRTSAGVTPAVGTSVSYSQIGAYGSSGIPTTAITGEPDGVLASNVIADILDRAAPGLNYTTGADGTITTTDYAIPHLVFATPGNAEDALLFVNAYHNYEWFVWENQTFYYRPTDPDRLCWEARLSEGTHLDLEGQQSADVYNGVYLTFTDPLGKQLTAGPVGSGADYESALLEDTSDTNPINQRGLGPKWLPVNVSQMTTSAGAIAIGGIYLAEAGLPQFRGTIRCTGTVTHPTRGERPAWAPRSGDYIRISDHPTDVARRIISKRYDHDSRTVSLEVGNDVRKVDAILSRLQIASARL